MSQSASVWMVLGVALLAAFPILTLVLPRLGGEPARNPPSA